MPVDITADELTDRADRLEAAHFELCELLAGIEILVADTPEAASADIWLTTMRAAAGTFIIDLSPAPTFASTIAAMRARAEAAADPGGNQ